MEIDMGRTFVSPDGEIILKDGEQVTTPSGEIRMTGGTPLTLGDIVKMSLISDIKDEKISGSDKHERYHLAQKYGVKGGVNVDLEHVVLIKELIGKICGIVIVGQAWDMLEGK